MAMCMRMWRHGDLARKGGDVQVALAVTQCLDTDGHGWRSDPVAKAAATNS